MILVGADPEVFVKKNNEFFSGHGLIPGTKQTPMPVEMGAVQVDGMALEFNITPAKSRTEFVRNIGSVLATLKSMVPEYEVHAVPVADFSFETLMTQPHEALELGCDPDFNAWTGRANRPPNAAVEFRTASGHVHIGWTDGAEGDEHFELCCRVVRELDFTLGIPSLLWDKDTRRRSLYGTPGAFRPKKYGAEYRVLSNVWLNSESLMGWVYDKVVETTDTVLSGKELLQDKHKFPSKLFKKNTDETLLIKTINDLSLETPNVL